MYVIELRMVASLTRKHNTRVSAETQMIDDKTTTFTPLIFILLMTSQLMADDVTIPKQLWRNHVNINI